MSRLALYVHNEALFHDTVTVLNRKLFRKTNIWSVTIRVCIAEANEFRTKITLESQQFFLFFERVAVFFFDRLRTTKEFSALKAVTMCVVKGHEMFKCKNSDELPFFEFVR